MEVSFAEDRIHLLAYDFPGATVHPTGILTAAQIRDADWKTAPPQIRTRLGEPFLDTWFDPEDQLTTVNRLREAGLSDEEVVGIRQRRTPLMHACNFDSMLWEWVNLGLFDLLNAATGPLVKASIQATLGGPDVLRLDQGVPNATVDEHDPTSG